MSNGKKKTLLREHTIRRFMKLANMEALQENYFDQYGLGEQEEETEMEDEVEFGSEDVGGEEEMEVGAEEEVEMGDEELGGEGGDVDEAAIRDLVDTIATAIEDKYDIPMSVEGGEEEAELGGEEEVELGGEEEVELGGEEEMGGEEEVEMGAEEELMELLDDAGIEIVDNEPIVQEVLKRVAKRLIREKMKVSK